ncbi:hypothetical protein KIW84_054549 [Lathyrus oleraceus]|uniref:Uncharacterized protein n=1 Tax=Pisum sativum TaxID=3888 RepID=A0A9D4WVX0_PEA|nr:hypothetical protein KIW84_054549 [Pisum sativum]
MRRNIANLVPIIKNGPSECNALMRDLCCYYHLCHCYSVSYYMCMLLKKNVLLRLCEPAYSLDSVSEISVIQALSNITFKGNIIISSIHHPGRETFTIFDGLMLLSSGKTVLEK